MRIAGTGQAQAANDRLSAFTIATDPLSPASMVLTAAVDGQRFCRWLPAA